MQSNKFKSDDHRFDRYIHNLKEHGLIVHPSLQPAIFTLNNGLEYPGLRVTSNVKGEQNLVTVPVELLLTAHKARQEPGLQTVFSHSFYSTGSSGEFEHDRILITYLLFLYSEKDETNIWYQMVELFSKEIDILSFWEEKELQKFSDKSVERAASLEKQNFEKEWKEFQNVISENNEFFEKRKDIYTKENYQWIYVHGVSRCFGSYMNSTYFTPFCEFFNHHCVDVSYECVTKEEHDNLSKEKPKEVNQNSQKTEDELSETSSISSGNSVDYIDDGDFNYWEVESYKIKWGGKISFDLKDKETKEVEKLHVECQQKLEKNILWNGFSFAFIGQIIEKINILKNEYMAGRKKFPMVKEEFVKIKALIENYKSQVVAFYRIMGGKYDPKAETQQTIGNLNTTGQSFNCSTSLYAKTSSPPTKDYKYFLMDAGPQTEFHENEQIYFCYGRISNRTMLTRYGCCIENNRYEHVWLKLGLNKILSPYPDLFERLQEKGLPIRYKLKLRPEIWAYELYLWYKLEKWELTRHSIHEIFYPFNIDQEVEIFQQMLEIIKDKVHEYDNYSQYEDLSDESISYHEYFTRVYHKEKIRILKKQISMITYVLEKLKLMMQAKRSFSPKEIKTFEFGKELKGYWKILLKGQISF